MVKIKSVTTLYQSEQTTRIIFLILSILFCISSYAQETQAIHNPPVNTEFIVGNKGTANQTIINKKLQGAPRFGYFAITYFKTEWNTKKVNEYMLQGNVSYRFAKGFDFTVGYQLTEITGIRPSVGLIYTFANQDWLVVIVPRGYMDTNANLEGFLLTEYKPKISEKWRYYSRLQANYVFTAKEGNHDRSYLWLRAGVSYKDFTFGIATNLDYYGPMKHNENNFGGFFSINLF